MKTHILFAVLMFIIASLTATTSLFGIILNEEFNQYYQYSLIEKISGVLVLAGLTGFYASLGWLSINKQNKHTTSLATKTCFMFVCFIIIGLMVFGLRSFM